MRWLNNPTSDNTEFQFGGRVYSVKAHETKGFDDSVVKHYLGSVSGPLVEVSGVAVRIRNNTKEDQTFNGVTIKSGEIIELPKSDAKAFIRAVPGVFWATEDLKKNPPEVAERVGERGPEVE